MKTRSQLLLALAAATTIAGAAAAVPTSEYLMKAGAGDLYEKTSSKLVLGSTTDPKIKKFANEMIADHTKSTAMVKAAAAKSGLKPKPPMLDADQKKMVADLTAAKGAARDQLYVTQQKTAHAQALALHSDYASSGDKPALKAAASQIVPVVKMHISMLDNGGAM